MQKKTVAWQKILILCIILALISCLLYLLKDLLTPFILAVFLSYLLSPVVDFLERRGFTRNMAILLLFLGFSVLIALSFYILFPKVKTQVITFLEHREEYIDKIKNFSTQAQEKLDSIFSFGEKKVRKEMPDFIGNLLKQAPSKFISIASVIPTFILVIFVTAFFLKDGRAIKKLVISFVPNRYFEMTLSLLYEIDQEIRNYIRGQLIDCLVVGILYTFGLYLIHTFIVKINYFIILGIIAGASNIIPYLGPFIGAGVSIIVTELTLPAFSFTLIIWILILTAVVQLIDNTLTGPVIVGKSVDLHPLIIIIALLIGAKVMSLIGMLIAVPCACAIKVAIQLLRQRFRDYAIV